MKRRDVKPPDSAKGLISRGTSAKAGTLMRPQSESVKKTSEFGVVRNVPFTKGLNTGMMNNHFTSQTESQKDLLEKFKSDSRGIASKLTQLTKKVSTKKQQIKKVAHNTEWGNEWKKLRKIQRELESEIVDEMKAEREEYYYEIMNQVEEGQNNPLKSIRESIHRLILDKIERTTCEIYNLENEINTLFKNYESLNPNSIDMEIDNNTFSADEFVNNILRSFNYSIDTTLTLILEEFKKKINQIIELYKQGKVVLTPHNWASEDHERYKHVYRQYQNGEHFGKNLVSYWELLKNTLPTKSETDIKDHDMWYKKVHKIEIHKIKENKERLLKDLEKIESISKETISFYIESEENKKKEELERKRFNVIAEEARRMLEEQLILKEEKTKVDNERKAKEEEIRKQEEDERDLRERERREKLKEQLEKYFKEKEEINQIQEEERKKEQERLKEEQVLTQKLNKERVDFRKNKEFEKLEKKKEEQKKREEEALKREAQLNKLIESVYEEMNLLEIDIDTKRLNQPTQSLLNKQKEEEEQVEKLKLYGYTADQLMKDRKFKLQLLLQEAGLLNTDYAREIFSTLKPSRLTRVDNLTTDQKTRIN
ncbi:predicted protein [Naegleria gruberi]|uniref:Predicted protein n=1 Tax=Naegleria gruberi TaxID=5762 RepID=D2VNY9_NAEGR|nr:uncharacterized protein NAEGRDRAFT_70667 [Naegleria gruberi]EFC41503.1 predicted protein [Naegleria gruberi]|eukprot:XP_002674247.1 predicted protein [Naegleria gruberi strain NEG-M]